MSVSLILGLFNTLLHQRRRLGIELALHHTSRFSVWDRQGLWLLRICLKKCDMLTVGLHVNM